MATTLEKLSGSTDGRAIKVAATATPGTLIHTAHATSKDRIILYAVNTDTASVKLTLENGGVTSPDDLIEVYVPPESGPVPVYDGLLTNSLALRAFAATANVVTIIGRVYRNS